MKQVLITFSGYFLITVGLSILYLILFRKDRMPKIFSKLWFIIIMIIVATIFLVLGWLILE